MMSGNPKGFIPDATEYLRMTPAELAGNLILGVLKNSDNFVASELAQFMASTYGDTVEIKVATMEALAWLISEALVTPHFEKSSTGEASFRLTKEAMSVRNQIEINDLLWIRQTLPKALLHAVILQSSVPIFLSGKYDTAVFDAFKQVEIAIRKKTGLTQIGVSLAREAFKQVTGPLTDTSVAPGEQQGLSDLFAGAFGSPRNATGHNNVTMAAQEAAELLIFASHLYRIVDRRT